MITSEVFVRAALEQGFGFYSGVPCSFLTPLINHVTAAEGLSYVPATSEGEALAICAGAWLAGRRAVTMCQNSGLGNLVNPLTSLCQPYRIPVLLVCTWRGQPGRRDEPQHELMGRITPDLLSLMEVSHEPFPASDDAVVPALRRAGAAVAGRRSRAFVVASGMVTGGAPAPAAPRPRGPGTVEDLREQQPAPSRLRSLECFLDWVPDAAAVVSSTGKVSRELYTLADRDQHFYQAGSMGCASAIGLGVALNSARPVVVLDGDGAALMRLGNLATIGALGPANLVHIILDNGTYDSTGGQPTVSPGVDFAGVATACGYRTATRCDTLEGFAAALKQQPERPGPHLIHLRIATGSMPELGRPAIPPDELSARFRAFAGG
jgi:phosphonopyruvate decarboxylase